MTSTPKIGFSMFDLPLTDPFYTFVDRGGTPTHIACGVLRRALEKSQKAQPYLCEFGESLIGALKRGELGVEEEHALKLPDTALEAPGIVGQWGSDHILIDGAHRLWRRWQRGDTDFPAYMVPEELWRLFVIYDVPFDGAFWDHHNRNSKVRG